MNRHKGDRSLSRPRKRKYYGPRNTSDANTDDSASARKIKSANAEDVIVNVQHAYRIIEFISVFRALAEILICAICKRSVTFAECGQRGLGFKIVVSCACGRKEICSSPLVSNAFEINRRIVFVMRLLGIAREGLNLFCGLMDICKGLSKSGYDAAVEHIYKSASQMFEAFTKKAVDEEKVKNSEHGRFETHLKVSGDGSWKKRGFTSLFGVTTLIGYYSGKVIDVVVKSSFCLVCLKWNSKKDTPEYEEWYETHKDTCSSNHEGSAGKMEVDSINEMFGRSEEQYGVKYVNYIGDGDSKTFANIVKKNPYGDENPVVKSECVGHVQKRMGTRLRNVKKEAKIGGKGKLTDALIKKLTIFYGLAIRRNLNSVKDMRNAIMATLDHYCSTDKKPRHKNCPAGADSWCDYRKAQATKSQKSYKHPPRVISPEVEKFILPIYEDLSRDDLLTKCLGGHTQNANESFNAMVWKLCPKHLHSGRKVVEISAYIAAGVFNEGYAAILVMMNLMGIVIGHQTKMFADQADASRLACAERRHSATTKEARTAQREARLAENELFMEEEGLLYGPGIAD